MTVELTAVALAVLVVVTVVVGRGMPRQLQAEEIALLAKLTTHVGRLLLLLAGTDDALVIVARVETGLDVANDEDLTVVKPRLLIGEGGTVISTQTFVAPLYSLVCDASRSEDAYLVTVDITGGAVTVVGAAVIVMIWVIGLLTVCVTTVLVVAVIPDRIVEVVIAVDTATLDTV